MKEMYKVTFTGHRPGKIGGYDATHPQRMAIRHAIKSALQRAIAKFSDKEIVVISGGALGVDTDAASVAKELGLRFMIAAPCRNQDKPWQFDQKKRYASMCRAADADLAAALAVNGETVEGGVVFVHNGDYNRTCMQDRNVWMVNHADAVVAVWDGTSGGTANCVNYARSKKVPMVLINPNSIELN